MSEFQKHKLDDQGKPVNGIFDTSATQEHGLGRMFEMNDGSLFRYAKAGSSDLAAGKLTQSKAPESNHTNVATGVAVQAGATEFTFDTALNTDAVEDEYAEGMLLVTDATGEGHRYRIEGNTAGSKPTVKLIDPIVKALEATSEVSLVHNAFDGSIIAPTTLTGTPNGVPLVDVPADNYYWSLVNGDAPALTSGTVVIGNAVKIGGSSGAVTPLSDTDAQDKKVGIVRTVGSSGEYSLVKIGLD